MEMFSKYGNLCISPSKRDEYQFQYDQLQYRTVRLCEPKSHRQPGTAYLRITNTASKDGLKKPTTAIVSQLERR